MDKIIGIIGGAGPEASAKLYNLIIQKCITNGCRYDWEFPHIIIDSVPFKDIVKNLSTHDIRLQFEKSISTLKNAGADYILVNCNSLYALNKDSKYKIENLPIQVYEKIKSKEYTKIGLLATSATIQNQVYDIFSKNRIEIKTLDKKDQLRLDEIILNVGNRKYNKKEFIKILQKIRRKDIDAILLGCTDLSLYYEQTPADVIDTLEIVADLAVDYYMKNRNLKR